MNTETIVDITQYGSADPSYVWRKGGTTDNDNHFYLIRGTTDTVVNKDDNVYIEVDPDKKVVIFHNEAKLLNGMSFTDNSLNGTSIKDHSITGDKIAQPITLKGSIDQLTNGNLIDGVRFDGSVAINHFDSCTTLADQQIKVVGCNNFNKENGSLITVRFEKGNTAEDVQLNVNDTGAAPVFYRNQKIDPHLIVENSIFSFVYFNGQYHTIDSIDNQVAQKYINNGSQYNLLVNPTVDHKNKTLTGSVGYIDTVSINPLEKVSVFKGSVYVDPIDKETNLRVATCGFVQSAVDLSTTDSNKYTDSEIVKVKQQAQQYTDAQIAPLAEKYVDVNGDTMLGKLYIPEVDSQAGDNQVVSAKWTRTYVEGKLGDVDLSSVLSLKGGTMTGPLHVVAPALSSNDSTAVSSKWVKDTIAASKPPEVDLSSCVKKDGDTMKGLLTVIAPPIDADNEVAVNSKWVRSVIRDIVPPTVDMSNYLAKTGGTMTGPIILPPNQPLSNDNTAATTKFVVDNISNLSDTIVNSFEDFQQTVASSFVNNERFGQLKQQVETVSSQVSTLQTDFGNRLNELTSALDRQQLELTDKIDAITATIETIKTKQEQITTKLAALEQRLATLETAPTSWYQDQVDQALQTLNG